MKPLSTALTGALLAGALAAPLGAAPLSVRSAAVANGWAPTRTQALALRNAVDFGAVPAQLPMHLTLGLTGDRAGADALIRRISTKGDPLYHAFLTPAQFTALFAPSPASANAVASYLQSNGFTNVAVAPNRLIVTATANAANVQRAFNTTIHALSVGGKPIFGNVAPAYVPTQLAGAVTSVLGLSNLQATTFHVRAKTLSQRKTVARKLGTRTIAATGCTNPGPVCLINGYYPNDLRLAYDDEATVVGRNTSVAIFTEGDISQPIKDLYQSWVYEGLAFSPINEVDVLGKATDTSGDDEWDIDSQASTNLAGGVKSLTFYNGTDLGDASIAATFDRWVTDDVATLANASFGGCEALSQNSGAMATDDLILAEGVLQGQSLFASSGDAGSQCSLLVNAGAPVGAPVQVEYPASSPYATAVGGTSLVTNSADGTYNSEIAWVNGGGGISLFENASPWQYANITMAQTTARRLVPDIAMDADPNVGGMLVNVAGTYTGYGGTSLASPLAMGIFARVSGRHNNALGQAAASLYQNYNFEGGNMGVINAAPAAALTNLIGGFHDIYTGSNTAYAATPGYDLTTGIGTLDINRLVIAYGS